MQQRLFIILLTALLAACTPHLHTARDHHSVYLVPQANQTQDMLQLSVNQPSTEHPHYYLQAARNMAYPYTRQQAKAILQAMDPSTLDAQQHTQYQLIAANLARLDKHTDKALRLLSALDDTLLDDNDRRFKHYQLMQIYYQQHNIDAILTLQEHAAQSDDDQFTQQPNIQKTWQHLSRLTLSKLEQLRQNATTSLTLGWIDFAISMQQLPARATHPNDQLLDWQKHYPDHPAQTILSNDLSLPSNHPTPSHIGLLLPTSGKLHNIGQAIQDGFISAFYTTPHPEIRLSFFDAHDPESALTAYQAALAQNCDQIIGPLSKESIQPLVDHHRITVPTLALNTLDSSQHIANLYQFSLSPLLEIPQIVNFVRMHGHQHALIISENNVWENKLAHAFQTQWEQLGGITSDHLTIDTNQSINVQIRDGLHITKSQQHAHQLGQLLREKLKFLPQRRTDMDMIFIALNPDRARTVIPLLKYYFSGDVPVFSTSYIYSGVINTHKDRDLDGVTFSDGQMLPPASSSTHAQNRRFFALGLDSFLLGQHLAKLTFAPGDTVYGSTGALTLNNEQIIMRKLNWYLFRNGTPVLQHPIL